MKSNERSGYLVKFKVEVMLEPFEVVMVLKFAEYQETLNNVRTLTPEEFKQAMDIKAYFGEWALKRLLEHVKVVKEK